MATNNPSTALAKIHRLPSIEIDFSIESPIDDRLDTQMLLESDATDNELRGSLQNGEFGDFHPSHFGEK